MGGNIDEDVTGSQGDVRPLVVFSLDGQRYAIGLEFVQRVIRVVAVTALPNAPGILLGIVDLGGVIVPVVDIRQRFFHPHRAIRLSDQLVVAVAGTRTVALLVDEALGVLQMSSDRFVPSGSNVPAQQLVEGALKLEDGLVLIHDLRRLLSLDEQQAIDVALEAGVAAEIPKHERVPRNLEEGAARHD